MTRQDLFGPVADRAQRAHNAQYLYCMEAHR